MKGSGVLCMQFDESGKCAFPASDAQADQAKASNEGWRTVPDKKQGAALSTYLAHMDAQVVSCIVLEDKACEDCQQYGAAEILVESYGPEWAHTSWRRKQPDGLQSIQTYL